MNKGEKNANTNRHSRAGLFAGKPELAEGTNDELVSETDGLTVRLFGAAPDYSKKEFEDLWQLVFNADEKEMIDFCREKALTLSATTVFPYQAGAMWPLCSKQLNPALFLWLEQ